jgi:hypothetical protein
VTAICKSAGPPAVPWRDDFRVPILIPWEIAKDQGD